MKNIHKKNHSIQIILIALSFSFIICIICVNLNTKKINTVSNKNSSALAKTVQKKSYANGITYSSNGTKKVTQHDSARSINQNNRNIKNTLESQNYNGLLKKINGSANVLNIPTYDGSGQAMHPKVLYFPEKWNGWSYWMAFTPYKGGVDDYENPSIVVSQDGIHWRVPPNLINPVIPPPVDVKAGGHNSDPHLVMNGNIMELWYRYNPGIGNERPNHNINCIYRETSRNGVNWSAPKLIFNSYLHGEKYAFYSPAVLFENGVYKLWFTTDSGEVVYTESKDCITWSNPLNVNLSLPGFCPWHIDIIHTDEGYEMVFCSYPKGKFSRNIQSLFYADSSDGINWVNVKQILKPYVGTNRLDNQQIYRSSLVKIDGIYRLYYSAMNKHYVWHTFIRQGKTIDTLQDVNTSKFATINENLQTD